MIIHRYWAGPPSTTEPFGAAVLTRLGQLHDHTDATLPPSVRFWLDDHAALATPRTRLRHRANMIRWWALATFGGAWFDHDALPLTPLDRFPSAWTAALGQARTSCACAFPVGHPLPLAMLDHVDTYNGPSLDCWHLSGDRLVDQLCDEEVARIQLPYDAAGGLRTSDGDGPQIVHLWTSSHRRFIT